jgi:NitT/TauT family transport system ATP-binding protein
MAGSASILNNGTERGQQEAALAKIEIAGLSKIFKGRNGDVVALQNTDLTIRQNEFVCVVGPSGCGKTTLLNIIGGLEKASSGSVKVDGKEVTGPGKERGVVFQQYALFPWKTVLKNVEFGLKLRGLGKQERKEKAESYLEMVGLKDFAHSYPKELSGGMKQRVAIARAYAVQPEVLLMDEPFGALDAQTRAQLQEDLLRTWQKEKKTCFFITHDVEEAVILAQRVIIMSARPGRIKEMIDVDIPYPRDQATKLDSRFVEIKNEIWSKVYKEYLEVSK